MSGSSAIEARLKALELAEKQAAGSKVKRQKKRYNTVADYHAAINPYFATLVDPVFVRGVRIPDPVTMPSATFSVTLKGTFSNVFNSSTSPVSCSEICAITFGGSSFCAGNGAGTNQCLYQTMLIPNQVNAWTSGGWNPAFNSWCMGFKAPGQESDVFNYALLPNSDAGEIVPTGFYTGSAPGSIPNTFTNVRLVSAALIVSCENAVTATQGRLIAASLPRRATRASAATTLASLENRPDATSIPLNQCQPINVVYQPQDAISQSYAPLYGTLCPTAGMAYPGSGAYPSGVTWNSVNAGANAMSTDSTMDMYAPGELWVVAAGLDSNAATTFQYVITLNYEGIPNEQSTFLVNTAVSKDDPLALAHAKSMTAGAPKVMSGAQWLAPIAQAPPVAHHRDDPAPTILDHVVNGLNTAVDIGEGITTGMSRIAAPVAKLLSSFF